MLPSIITEDNVVVVIDNEAYNFNTDHFNYAKLLDAIKNNDKDEFLKFYQQKEEDVIQEYSNNNIKSEGGKYTYKGLEIGSSLARRIIEMSNGGFSVDHFMKFLDNLIQNPSMTSIRELYDFLENRNIPITEDGCFLGYKAVCTYLGNKKVDPFNREIKDGDLVDKYSRTTRNNVGDVISVPRNQVDDNRNNQCSYGYHVGGLEYATQTFFSEGDTVVIVKVNPKDVVSVPLDYNAQKLRTCAYEVIGIYKDKLNKPVYTAEDDLDYDEGYEEECEVSFTRPVKSFEVRVGDVIKFDYKGNSRHVFVDENEKDYIIGILEEDDHSYDGEIAYRRFDKNEMSNVYLVQE